MSPVIGHRGVASLAPENTLAGIRKAAEIGLKWIEMDVTLLCDNTPVMFHDARLQRTTDSRGYIHQSSQEDIRRIDAGGWFSPNYKGEKIPLLAEALSIIKDSGMGLNLELKPNRCDPKLLAHNVLQTIEEVAFPEAQLLISSFSYEALFAYRQASHHPLGCLFERLPNDGLRQAEDLKAVSIHVNASKLTEKKAQVIKAASYELYCYTVNNVAEAQRLWQWGVDGLFSDTPQTLTAIDNDK